MEIGDRAQQAAAQAKDKATEVVGELAGKANELAGKAGEHVGELAEKATELAGKAAERAGELATKGVEVTTSTLNTVTGGSFSGQIDKVADTLTDALGKKDTPPPPRP